MSGQEVVLLVVGILLFTNVAWAVAVAVKNRAAHSNFRIRFKYDSKREAESEQGKNVETESEARLKCQLRVNYYQNRQSVPADVTLEIVSGARKVVKHWTMKS
jgi:hypothetical protein